LLCERGLGLLISHLGGQRINEPVAAPIPTIFLNDRPFGYTDQDWISFPGIARQVLRDTLRIFWVYWAGTTGEPVEEDGILISPAIAHLRCRELSAGLTKLIPHL